MVELENKEGIVENEAEKGTCLSTNSYNSDIAD